MLVAVVLARVTLTILSVHLRLSVRRTATNPCNLVLIIHVIGAAMVHGGVVRLRLISEGSVGQSLPLLMVRRNFARLHWLLLKQELGPDQFSLRWVVDYWHWREATLELQISSCDLRGRVSWWDLHRHRRCLQLFLKLDPLFELKVGLLEVLNVVVLHAVDTEDLVKILLQLLGLRVNWLMLRSAMLFKQLRI